MRVAVLSKDLLDRSRIEAAVVATGVESVAPEDADLVFVDLRFIEPGAIVEYAEFASVVAYGPHVQTDVLAAASAAGALALPRSQFFQRLPGLLAGE